MVAALERRDIDASFLEPWLDKAAQLVQGRAFGAIGRRRRFLLPSTDSDSRGMIDDLLRRCGDARAYR